MNIEVETEALRRRLDAASRVAAPPRRLREQAEIDSPVEDAVELVTKFAEAIASLEKVNAAHPDVEGLAHALFMRDEVLPAMEACAIADIRSSAPGRRQTDSRRRSTSEMLFIK